MEGSFGNPRAVEKEIQAAFSSGRDKIVRPLFGLLAPHVWPGKTAAIIAEIADVDEKTARRWLSGEFAPPPCVAAAMFSKIFPPRRR